MGFGFGFFTFFYNLLAAVPSRTLVAERSGKDLVVIGISGNGHHATFVLVHGLLAVSLDTTHHLVLFVGKLGLDGFQVAVFVLEYDLHLGILVDTGGRCSARSGPLPLSDVRQNIDGMVGIPDCMRIVVDESE